MNGNNRQKLTIQQARAKIEHYCNYQERCHKEVSSRLYEYGLTGDDAQTLLAELVKSGLLNEERFAIAFAGGKFRQKQWGRNKIRRELKIRDISDFCIRRALGKIDEDDYRKTILILAEKYGRTLRDKSPAMREKKTMTYMVSKGFEHEICREMLAETL